MIKNLSGGPTPHIVIHVTAPHLPDFMLGLVFAAVAPEHTTAGPPSDRAATAPGATTSEEDADAPDTPLVSELDEMAQPRQTSPRPPTRSSVA